MNVPQIRDSPLIPPTMSKFRAGKWRSDEPARTNTGSSIRGKISAPIPFPDDDEFPIRTPGTGIATPLGSDGIETRLRESLAAETENKALQTGIPIGNTEDPNLSSLPAAEPTQPLPETQIRRTNQLSALRNSGTSVPSASSIGKPQRKKSSFRSALSRLFGKKSKNGGATVAQEPVGNGARAGQHRSDPTALNRSPTDGAESQKRSASLPINEYNRALRSHSTATEEFPNVDNGTNAESIHADGQRRPRRATTPSRLWTPTVAPPGYGDRWTGLSPRPASSHARGSRVVMDAEAEAATGIGMAITSGSHPNRRSRSLGEMREAAAARTVARRRSDEIRYWRESYDPGILSPMSSNKPEEPIVIDEPEENRDDEPQEQPQPFNFGPLGEMAGMKITQAASLDSRVRQLEERMLRMERVLYRDRSPTSGDPFPIQDRSSSIPRPTTDNSEMSLPKYQRHRETQVHQQTQESRPQGSQQRSSSYGSSRPSTTSTHISYHPSFDTFSPPMISSSEPPASSQNTVRPLSTSTTIRGIPSSSPTLPKDGHFTAEHYTALTNMILAEQAARRQLEAVVHSLQQQLHALSSSASVTYPRPSSGHLADQMRGDSVAGGEFSNFEQDDSSDDEGRYIQEDFQTPSETRGNFGSEIFGDAIDHGETKSAPRTLSLSQITLGKGAQHSLNFQRA